MGKLTIKMAIFDTLLDKQSADEFKEQTCVHHCQTCSKDLHNATVVSLKKWVPTVVVNAIATHIMCQNFGGHFTSFYIIPNKNCISDNKPLGMVDDFYHMIHATFL